MRDFNENRGRGFGGGNRFGGGRDRGGRAAGRDFGNRRDFGAPQREMFTTVCDDCGNDCEVPFRPSGEKPVYCSNCFEKRGGPDRDNERRPERRESSRFENKRPENNDKLFESISSLNSKLDRILYALEGKAKNDVPPVKPGIKQKDEAVKEVVAVEKKEKKAKAKKEVAKKAAPKKAAPKKAKAKKK